MKRPLGAQISHMLKARGVDTIFGIPGVHNQEMYRGIEEAGITHVLARHEQGAGFMADGYARASGKPGVAYVITGPGLCNIMTPMGQAYSDSVPLLVVSSCLDEVEGIKGQLHQMKDQRGAAATVCDWSAEARTADAAYTLIDRALTEMTAQRPRPKHIQVPISVLEASAEAAPAPRPYTAPSLPQMGDALDRILGADRLLFVFGGGAQVGFETTRKALKALGAASFTTYAGRGIVGTDDPLHFGAALSQPSSADVIASADVVVVVGSELAEVDLWRAHLGHQSLLVRVDIDPQAFTNTDAGVLNILCDGPLLMRALLERAEALGKTTSGWSVDEVAKSRTAWRADTDAARPGIARLCDALRDVLPEDTMIYSDMTQFAYVAQDVWPMTKPGHWHHPYGFGTLGYATPAAIGGAIARPGLPTLAIIGDYGFHYTMQELGVAVELGLPLPIILWDNGKLKEIEDSMTRAQIAPNAVIARNPDFCKLAEAFGAYAAAPKTIQQMQQAVTDAFRADGPTLIYLTPDITG